MDTKQDIKLDEEVDFASSKETIKNDNQEKFIMRESEIVMLHDISKTAITGMQSIDVVMKYVENMDFRNYLKELNDAYAEINERTTRYMTDHNIESDFFASVKQAFQRSAVKISMLTSSSDKKIAEHMIKGTNAGLDCVAKNLNSSNYTLSPELIALTKDFEALLNISLEQFRKYL
jgi:hypothetical protein